MNIFTLNFLCVNIEGFEELFGKKYVNIGIANLFSCINNFWVPRKMFEHKANRPSAQTSPKGPGNY